MKPRTPFASLALILLLAPSLVPLSSAISVGPATSPSEPWIVVAPVEGYLVEGPPAGEQRPQSLRVEGWGFDRASHGQPLGRVTLVAEWHDAKLLQGTLRMADGTTYSFDADHDPEAWQDRDVGMPVERYVGTARSDDTEAAAPAVILLDHFPSQGYLGGYLAQEHSARVSFQLYESAAVAIEDLPILMETATQSGSLSQPQGAPNLPSGGNGETAPSTLAPQSRTPLDTTELPEPEPVEPPEVAGPTSSSSAAGGGGATGSKTGPSQGQAEARVDPGGGGGNCDCSGGGGDPPPPPPNYAPQARQPTGPPLLPVGQLGEFVSSASDQNGDEVLLTFHWGDGTTSQTTLAPSNSQQSSRHAWSAPGTYSVTVVATDTKGATGPPSSPFSVAVVDVSGNVPDPNDYVPEPGEVPSAPPNVGPVAIFPPDRPGRPHADETRPDTGEVVTMTGVSANPTRGGSVRYRFNWDDNATSWTPWVAQGQPGSAQHTWATSGAKRVQVQAQNMQNCNAPAGTILTCLSPWSEITLVHVGMSSGAAPAQPSPAEGWNVVARQTSTIYESIVSSAADVRYEFDWGDLSATTLTPIIPSGNAAEVSHEWARTGTHELRVRAISQSGAAGPWSSPLAVRVGTETQRHEIVVANFSVNNPTPRGTNLTDPTDPLSIEPGETISLSALIENRAPTPVTVDVTFLDDGKPFDTRPWTIAAGNSITATSTHPMSDAFGLGVHQLSVQAGQSILPELEVAKSNNQRFLDIRVRDPPTEAPAFGAHHDGPGPLNVEGIQLTTGLYQQYRADDANTYDEIAHSDSAAMRLLLWSPQFAGIPNQTWYFTDRVQVSVQATDGLSLANPTPMVGDTTVSHAFPLTIGYSERAGNGRTLVGMDYHVKNGSTLASSASNIQWHILTNRTPTSQTNTIGVEFTTQAPAGSASDWKDIQYDASLDYTRVERQGDGRLLVWHDTVKSGTSPIASSLETGTYSPSSVPYAQGKEFNVGDRSMTYLPVWEAPVESRRTYYDGTTDKTPRDGEGEGSTQSSAYHWFRLDGPIYQSHDLTWVFTSPNSETFSTAYHFAGPVERGYAEGTAFAWAEFRAPLVFTQDLAPQYKGAWTSHILIDGESTNRLTFHVMATTTDPPQGPENMTDEELANRTAEATGPVQKADPSNENLPQLDPTNQLYLEQKRVDGKINATEERVDDAVATYVKDYLLAQLEEVGNITFATAEPILPEPARRVIEPIYYDVIETLRDEPSAERIARTVQRSVWNVAQAVLATCNLDLLEATALDLQNLTEDATACVMQAVETASEATALLNETAGMILSVPNSTLSTVTTRLNYTRGLAEQTLADPVAAVMDAATPVTTIVQDAAEEIASILPTPPVPVNLHPKNLADLGCVVEAVCIYDLIMQAEVDSGGAKESGVSTLDSLFYNVYVANASKSWTILNVPVGNLTSPGNATLIDIDDDDTTGPNGKDLVITATLTPTQGTLEPPPLNASQTTPTLRVRALSDAARHMPLLACAYYQLPGVSFVAVTCLDTRNQTLTSLGSAPTSPGFVDAANMTLSAYAFDTTDPNVTASLRLETQTAHPDLSLLATGSIFQVDLKQHTKPRIANADHAEAAIFSSTGQGTIEYVLRRTNDENAGSTTKWTWTSTHEGQLGGSYSLARAGRTLSASSNATHLPDTLEFQAVRNGADSTIDITTRSFPPAPVGSTRFAFRDDDPTRGVEAGSLQANSLPVALTIHADDLAGTLTLSTQGGAPEGLKIVAANDRTTCPGRSTGDHVTRQPADANAGACLSLALSAPVEGLSVNLAQGGPTMSLVSPSGSSTPLAVLIRPASTTTRSLDAYFSAMPTSLNLQSSLAQPDGSTSLAWSATESLVQARILARSGTTLLYWNAADTPLSAQAHYQWSADAISINSNPANEGHIQFLLTNTGQAPTLPMSDYVTGTRAQSGQFAAAARLSGVSDFRASLATQDFRLDTTGSASEPFGMRYARAGGPAFTLDATPLPSGSFSLRSVAKEGGTHRLDLTSGSRGGDLSWVGNFPEGTHLSGDIADAPASFALTASPNAGTLAFDAMGDIAGRFSATHAPVGMGVATLAGDDVVHLRAAPGSIDTYRVSLQDVRAFTLAKTPGALATSSSQTAPHGLRVQVERSDEFLSANTTLLPTTLGVSYGASGFNYTAASTIPRPDMSVRVMENGVALGFTGLSMPTQAAMAWTSTTQASSFIATHNAADVPLLQLEANLGADMGNEFVRVRLEDAPWSVTANFNRAADEIQATASPTPAGVVLYQHAANAQSLQVPSESNHAIMSRQDSGAAFEALRLENMTSLQLRLGSQAGQTNQLRVVANTTNQFYAEYATSTGDMLRARLSNIPAHTDLRYALAANQGDANATGMQLTQTSGGITSTLTLHAEQSGYALSVHAANVPTDWRAAWAPSQAFDLRANAPIKLNALAYRAVDTNAPTIPGTSSFLLVDAEQPDAPRVGAAFPQGVTRARSDVSLREAQVLQNVAHASFSLLHKDLATTTSFRTTAPPASFTIRAPQVQAEGSASLSWNAIGTTGSLEWGLDAPNTRWRWSATQVPSLATVRVNAGLGSFTTSVPAGAGPQFRAQYTSDPSQPFYGIGPGLVLLANPAGPEGYPANLTTFTLDVPYVQLAAATFTGVTMEDGVGFFGASLRRSDAATPTSLTLNIVPGAEALRFTANNLGKWLGASWSTTPTDGFAASLTTDAQLQEVTAKLRGKDGIADVKISTVATFLELGLAAKAGEAGALDRRARLDYANGAAASSASVFADAAGAIANLTLASAPREFHAESLLSCGSGEGDGRAWTSPGEHAGHAHLVLVPRDAPVVTSLPEAERLVAACESDSASIQLDLTNFVQADWFTSLGITALVNVTTSAPTSAPTRLVFAADGNNIVLDARADTLPTRLSVQGTGLPQGARIEWDASQPVANANVTFLAPGGFANTSHANAPAAWSIGADVASEEPLRYSASGPTDRLVADTGSAAWGAHIDAMDVPSELSWTVPVTACPAPTEELQATVSTLGSGSIGELTYWILPQGAGEFDSHENEYAILTCGESGARSTAHLTGVKEITWTRTVESIASQASHQQPSMPTASPPAFMPFNGPLSPPPAPPSSMPTSTTSTATPALPVTQSIGIEREPSKANPTSDVDGRFDAGAGEGMHYSASAPVSSLQVSGTTTPGNIGMEVTRDATRPARIEAWILHAESPTKAVFTDPAGLATLSLDGTASPLMIDYAASAPAGGFSVDTTAAGPRVILDAADGAPTRLSGHISGTLGGSCSDETGAMSTAFSTHDTGSIGRFVARITDDARAPAIRSGAGATFACPTGVGRAFSANLPSLEDVSLFGNGCRATIVAEADSLRTSTYELDTDWFHANLTMRMAPTTVALMRATIGDGKVDVRADSNSLVSDPVLQRLNVTYERKAGQNLTEGTGFGCLTFGDASLHKLFFDADDLVTRLEAQLGSDTEDRTSLRVEGGGARALDAHVVTFPSVDEDEGEVADAEAPLDAHVAIGVDLPVSGAANITYTEGTDAPPGAPESRKNGNYAIFADREGVKGGNIRILGFDHASLILDALDQDGTTTIDGTLSYQSTTLGAPLAVIIEAADGAQNQIVAGSLPRTIDATLHAAYTDEWLGTAHLNFETSERTYFSYRSFDQARALRFLAETTSLVADGDLKITTSRNQNNELEAKIDYLSNSGNLPVNIFYADEAANPLNVNIDALPPEIHGKLTITSCGFTADATLSHRIDRISFYNDQKIDPDAEQSENPDCPQSTSGAEDSTTRREATVAVYGIPNGTLTLDMKTGAAGSLAFSSSGGSIDRALAWINTTDDKGLSKFQIDARDVILPVANWDIDGDTRYENNPNLLYLSSAGAPSGRIVFGADTPKKSIQFDSNGRVVFGASPSEGFQLKWYTKPVKWANALASVSVVPVHFEKDAFDYAGCMKLLDATATLRHSDWHNSMTALYSMSRGEEWGKC